MKPFVPIILLSTGVLLSGAEYRAEGLSVSDFDGDGRRLHRLVAVSATGPTDDPKLSDGRLEFFDVQTPGIEPIGVLTFVDAKFHRATREIEGEGLVSFCNAQGTVKGRGFKYNMTDGHLLLHSDLVLDTPSAHAVAKKGDAFIIKDPQSSKFGLSTARLTEEVIVTGSAVEKEHYDRVETDSATYTANGTLLSLSSPVTLWKGDRKTVAEGKKIEYCVGK